MRQISFGCKSISDVGLWVKEANYQQYTNKFADNQSINLETKSLSN
ncbi:hypothetical protein H1P_2630001 [Hyella patelloides LEGE 07179]|uniref:Uncharacterized protein n=1 Tax=Hyella patelloides LEGE 07179 TaxID=945734 RepID=A0A563VSN2_9CYAN|nr:hypothetical protein H1P_2630001 [Hyella patelloides LEGE 07179]